MKLPKPKKMNPNLLRPGQKIMTETDFLLEKIQDVRNQFQINKQIILSRLKKMR